MCKSGCCKTMKCCNICPPGRRGRRGLPGPPGSTLLFINNSVFVDEQYGNNINGQRENESEPFSTIQAAVAIAQPGDTIYVQPGTYGGPPITVDIPLNFYFTTGATFISSFIVTDDVDMRITGEGDFLPTTHLVTINNSQSKVNIRGNSITMSAAGSSLLSSDSVATVIAEFNTVISSSDTPIIDISQIGYLSFIFDNLTTEDANVITLQGPGNEVGPIHVNGTSIIITGSAGIYTCNCISVDFFFDVDTIDQPIESVTPLFTPTQDTGTLDVSSMYVSITSGVLEATSVGGIVSNFPLISFINIDELFVSPGDVVIPVYSATECILVIGQSTAMVLGNGTPASLVPAINIENNVFCSLDVSNVALTGSYRSFMYTPPTNTGVCIYNFDVGNMNINGCPVFDVTRAVVHISSSQLSVNNPTGIVMSATLGSIHIDSDIIQLGGYAELPAISPANFVDVDLHITSQQMSVHLESTPTTIALSPAFSISSSGLPDTTPATLYMEIDYLYFSTGGGVDPNNLTRQGAKLIETFARGVVHVKELFMDFPNGALTPAVFVSAKLPTNTPPTNTPNELSVKTSIANMYNSKYLTTTEPSDVVTYSGIISLDMGIVKVSILPEDFINVRLNGNSADITTGVFVNFDIISNTNTAMSRGFINLISANNVNISGKTLSLTSSTTPPTYIPIFKQSGQIATGIELYIDIDFFNCNRTRNCIRNENTGNTFINIKKIDTGNNGRFENCIYNDGGLFTSINIDRVIDTVAPPSFTGFIRATNMFSIEIDIGTAIDMPTGFLECFTPCTLKFNAKYITQLSVDNMIRLVNDGINPFDYTVGGDYMKISNVSVNTGSVVFLSGAGIGVITLPPTYALRITPSIMVNNGTGAASFSVLATTPVVNTVINSLLTNKATSGTNNIINAGTFTPNVLVV